MKSKLTLVVVFLFGIAGIGVDYLDLEISIETDSTPPPYRHPSHPVHPPKPSKD
jgi:hypothetical protein